MPLQILKIEEHEEECKQSSNKKSKSNKSRRKSKSRSNTRSLKKYNQDNETIFEGMKSIKQTQFEDSDDGYDSPSVKFREDDHTNSHGIHLGVKKIRDFEKRINKDILYRYLKSKETIGKKLNFRKILSRKKYLEEKYNSEERLDKPKLQKTELDLLALSNKNKNKSQSELKVAVRACSVKDKITFNKEKVSRLVDNPYVTKNTNFLSIRPRFSKIQKIETDQSKSRFLFSVPSSRLSHRHQNSFSELNKTRSATPMQRLTQKDTLAKKGNATEVIIKHLNRRQAKTVSKRRGCSQLKIRKNCSSRSPHHFYHQK
ncbi:unnamed protein product [Moneuplotes crassus]|uniref:Uncharacterized protein n=1 Tax=Euplotes crassus TaxID=5936 RepID=A0AAD1X4D1_EUPCR|nr:unnamed protein product [Moneuplotes crassus]